MDDIAEKAGVNKATIYYHIGDKQALYDEIIHATFSSVADSLEQSIDKSHSPARQLGTYIKTITSAFKNNPHMAPIMMRELASGGTHLPDLAVGDLARIADTISAIIQKGVETGDFIHTNPIVIHMMIVGTLAFYSTADAVRTEVAAVTNVIKIPDQDTRDEAGKEIEKLLLRALSA